LVSDTNEATRAAAHDLLSGWGAPIGRPSLPPDAPPDLARFLYAGETLNTLSDDLRSVMRAPGHVLMASDGHTLVASTRKETAERHVGAPLGPSLVCAMAEDVLSPLDSERSGNRAGWVAEVDVERLRYLLRGLTGTVRLRVGPVVPGTPVPSVDVCGPGWAARLVGKRGSAPVRA
jgi:hypothetical protein